MKNRNLIYAIALLALAAVAAWLIFSKDKSTTLERKMDYNFTIQDTAHIDKIVISDKTPAEVTLTRSDNGWTVDGKYLVRKGAINTLLETLYRMKMRNFIPKRMQPTVIKRMTVFGKKVDIYKNGELFKTLYVGTETQDEMATYMMIKGSDAPYAVYIPGFNGYLSSRFFTEEHLWRSRDITRMNPNDVQQIKMVYSDSANQSFIINSYGADSLVLKNLNTGEVVKNTNRTKLQLYVVAAARMKYEASILPTASIYSKRDSLKQSVPVFKISVSNKEGKTTTLEAYHMKPAEGRVVPEGQQNFDPDRLDAFINGDEMILVQYYGLRHVLKPLDYFTKP